MIEITVKTLDSQNHAFTVEDDMTVAQFKEKIAPTVNIPADTQRIIYCGKVLQDSAKLGECDVNGKVVHLVQRAPPQLNQHPSERSASASPPLRRGGFRGFESGNAMYLGSMAFPSNLMESQGIVPPPPTHSLAASRLNVAGRMLRRAEAVIRLLENPTLRPNEQQQPEETQEEITPVFEARIIVPNSGRNEPIDEALVLSAVQDTLLNANAVSFNQPASSDATANAENVNVESSQLNDFNDMPSQQFTSTPESVTPTRASNENLAAGSEANAESNTTSSLPENALPVSEMSELLTMLSQLQTRFAPFLERYQNFMQEDPTVAPDNIRQTQSMINRVSEVLHFLGHAYHSLSDIIVRVRSPPPRPLLCRPILIQHSAVVQTGFPIQVEAQINFSTTASGSTSTTNTTTSSAPSTTTTAAEVISTSTTTTSVISAQIQPTMVGLPFLPGSGMRVQSIPIEIRGLPRSNNISVSLHRPLNNNHIPNPNNSASQATTTSSNGSNSATTTTTTPASNNQSDSSSSTQTTTSSTTTTTTTSSERSDTTFNVGGFNNPNLEFFMEVTPESITIDSLETTLVGSNQAGDLLRGALNGPPPELLQSIVQMAGQIMNRHTGLSPATTTVTTSATSEPSAPPAETTVTTQLNVSASQAASGQNSQARGNTQTNPTTATHTRSTSRPHVHLAQHAMQGFDPFLPCNSHHVTPRRRMYAPNINISDSSFASSTPIGSPQRSQTESTNNATNGSGNSGDQLNPLYSVMQGIISSLRNVYGRGPPQTTQNAPAEAANNASSGNNENSSSVPNSSPLPSFSTFLPFLQNANLSDFNRDSPTIAQLLQQLPDESYVEGESIFTDLIMLLSQNLTLGDILQLNAGRLEPLNRIRNELRNFFMSRILDNTISPSSVERGVNRLMGELQPILDNLVSLQVRDDIDIVRSVQLLFRARLPNIINLAASRSPNSLRMLVEQCRITSRQLCALALRASANGQQGVEEVFNQIVTRYMQGIPNNIQHWTLLTSRVQLRQFMSTLSVPESVLQPYIVRKRDAVLPSVLNEVQNAPGDASKPDEAMEIDEQEASGSATELGAATINLAEDTEPLPRVVIGSETWHNQVPADWVPIIARDTQRQRRQNPQPPFSDAYLSGMPSKRRKIVASSKPQGSLPQVISESVRRAVTTTGLSSVAPLETVAQAAGADLSVQAAYRELLRTSVQSNIQNNEDFTPDRYPNASNYFNKQQ